MPVEVGHRRHLVGHLARWTAELLAQGQGAVGLEVGAVGGTENRVGPWGYRVERGLQPGGEQAEGVGHPPSSHFRAGTQPAGAAR